MVSGVCVNSGTIPSTTMRGLVVAEAAFLDPHTVRLTRHTRRAAACYKTAGFNGINRLSA